MRTVTFASYKGGVGRTQCLANVAIQLVKTGSRVGMVDLDFEASGLHQVFAIDVSARKSMIDVIADARPLLIPKVEIKIPLGRIMPSRKDDPLWLLPGHCEDAPRMGDIKWDADQIEALRTSVDQWQVKNGLDYVLLDTRAGMSAALGAAVAVCDHVAIVFRPNRQNIYGVKWMLKIAADRKKSHTLIASPVPNGNEAVRKLVSQAMDNCASTWGIEAKEIVQVPYISELALEEKVIVTAKGPSKPAVRVYEQLAKKIRSEERS